MVTLADATRPVSGSNKGVQSIFSDTDPVMMTPLMTPQSIYCAIWLKHKTTCFDLNWCWFV